MTLEIVTIPNEILTRPAEPFVFSDSGYVEDNYNLETAMIATATANNLYGLAAPQVGLSFQMFVVDMNQGKGKKNFVAFYNPVIKPVKTGNEKVDFSLSEEFCASVPKVGCVVKRWNKIIVTAQDAKGKEFTVEASGKLARIIQHEADHCAGILITSKAKQKRIVR
jgi:peptide deformylase